MGYKKYKLLDLYCKAGGGGYGYYLAGFEVFGVDIDEQPNYPFEFLKGDALKILKDEKFINNFDVIHASPPCQHYSRARGLSEARNGGAYGDHPDLIAKTRELLIRTGKPYIIENVVGAPLQNPISLSGSQFKNLYTQRKRLFESNISLKEPENKPIQKKTPPAGWGFGPDGVPIERLYGSRYDTPKERAFGDWSPGRWGWILRNPVLFEKPVPARGAQGFWNWEGQQ